MQCNKAKQQEQPDCNPRSAHKVSAQAPTAYQPWLFATQSQNTAVHCGLDPATKISPPPNFIVQCIWFQAACNPRSSHGCQCSAMLHLLVYVVKRQLTICFQSSKPIQIGTLLTDFQNSFTGRLTGKFATKSNFSIPPHPKHVSTLPCEIWMSEKWRQSEICIVINDKSQGH